MKELNITGGARIGMANASWPFATLKVNENIMTFNTGISGKLTFNSNEIISITPYSGFMSNGIQINHKVSKYNEKVIFWTFKKPELLINQIKQIGFFNNASNSDSLSNESVNHNKSKYRITFSRFIIYFFIINVILIFIAFIMGK